MSRQNRTFGWGIALVIIGAIGLPVAFLFAMFYSFVVAWGGTPTQRLVADLACWVTGLLFFVFVTGIVLLFRSRTRPPDGNGDG